jgi:uncharacterized protein YdaU (DUF1376 family)
MPLYWQDFRDKTLDLDASEIGVYMTLIGFAWNNGKGCVPGDMRQLKLMLQRAIANFHGHAFNRIVPKLIERYFDLGDDGNYYQSRVVKELEKMKRMAERHSNAASKRWANDEQTLDKRPTNDGQTPDKPSANYAQTSDKSPAEMLTLSKINKIEMPVQCRTAYRAAMLLTLTLTLTYTLTKKI